MKHFLTFAFVIICAALFAVSAFAQADTFIGQITSSVAETFIGGVSGDGRFVVFESRGNLATENPRNTDGNLEIFLFDYAQRRIFQITDTKSLLFNDKAAATFDNIRVDIVNTRPVISNDGRFIAFSSNATIAYPGNATNPPIISTTNPGSFDANAFTTPTPTPAPTASPTPTPSPSPTPGANSLANDGNLEMWIYQIPSTSPVADLSAGDEVPFTDLSGGTFTQVSNTVPSQLPRSGTTTVGPFIADDNHDASISSDGSTVAFVSTRDLVPGTGNTDTNDEIFTYVQGGAISQVTKTPKGVISDPIYNKNVSISGDGQHIVFASTGENPIVGFPACGSNPSTSRNEEVFFANISGGAPTSCKQVTTTTSTNPGDPVNIVDLGKRISPDGHYIAFDSYADLANENSGKNFTSFALYLYDTTNNTFKRVGPRSDADSGAGGGDVARYPGFTFDASNNPVLVLETRENIKADGTVPTTASDGLNPDVARPVQIYYVPIATPFTFTRITKFPAPSNFLASTQPFPTNTTGRLVFNLALTELGTGNTDLQSEGYYLIDPTVTGTTTTDVNFATGATALPITHTNGPTPTPTQQPSPTPTPTPTPNPPVTPASVTGMSPGMLTLLTFGTPQAIAPRTAVGSLKRQFNLPLELSGVTMSINGVSCGLKSVDGNGIVFVTPPFIASSTDGTIYPYVINVNGSAIKGFVTIVPTRPDIFRLDGVIGSGGRTKVFNVTNRVHTTEPFTVTTVEIKGGVRVPSKMRLYATGVANAGPTVLSIRIGTQTMTATAVTPGGDFDEPGVFAIDFALVPALDKAGNQPVVLSVNVSGVTLVSRVDDTTSFTRIL